MPEAAPLVTWPYIFDFMVPVRVANNFDNNGGESPNNFIHEPIVSCHCPHCLSVFCAPWKDVVDLAGGVTTYTCMSCKKDFRLEYGSSI